MNTTRGMRSVAKNVEPFAGFWDYDGSCAPKGSYSNQMTFSVACFQWIPVSNGEHLKRAKSVKRFAGSTAYPHEVYAKAEAFCLAQEAEAQR